MRYLLAAGAALLALLFVVPTLLAIVGFVAKVAVVAGVLLAVAFAFRLFNFSFFTRS